MYIQKVGDILEENNNYIAPMHHLGIKRRKLFTVDQVDPPPSIHPTDMVSWLCSLTVRVSVLCVECDRETDRE